MDIPISVVIRTKNESKHLAQVLKSIKEQHYEGLVEIVLVDSGSVDNTVSIAEEFGCSIVRLTPEEFTFGLALNKGIEHARGEIIVNLSGHTIPIDTSFLTNLVDPYADPDVVATFGRNVPLPGACPSEARDLEIWYPDELLDVPERFSNGNASLRKMAWERIPFNEEVSGSEDLLWAREMLRSGFRIVYVPSAAAYHSHSGSLKYAFVRRFRETGAMVRDGCSHGMSLSAFLKWTASQTVSDIRYAKRKQYFSLWYLHMPLYRASQGFAIYSAAAREGTHDGKKAGKDCVSLQERGSAWYQKLLGYYHKSCRIIENEGWGTFFFKAKRKMLSAHGAIRVLTRDHMNPVPTVSRFPSPRKFKVIFITDPVAFLTSHYRASNMREYLEVAHVESKIITENQLDYRMILAFDIVVLCRVFMNPHIEKLVEICRTLGIPVIFDADDFIIDPAIIDHIGALEGISEYEKNLHREGLRKHRESFSAADVFTAPTEHLAEAGRGLGKSSFVIRNGLSTSELSVSRKILDARRTSDASPVIAIGYFSGSRSHERDFAVAVPALIRIMEEFPYVHLCIGGYLDLDKRFEAFSHRVKRLPFVEIHQLAYNIAQVDINIAPLEVNNPFCEAKSELKYFDAGILKIPTVASPTDAYQCAVEHGVNGFLARSSEEWYDFLKTLIEDSELRAMMGQRAYEHVLNSYTPDVMAVAVKKVYEEIITQYRKKREISENALKISFVVPGPEQGSGGLNKVFTAARYLSEFGHSVCLYFLNDGKFRSHEQLKEFILAHYFDPQSDIILGTDAISSCDILCATSWKTAYAVQENRRQAAQLFYFVQDIESLFFPMGDEYLRAEHTYRMGMHHISFGPWCAKVLEEKYGAEVDHIPFSLNKKLYSPRPVEKAQAKRVIFFARPEMPRRCFRLGLDSLSIFHKRNPQVKLTFFGSAQISRSRIPFSHENLGVLSKEELARLYSGADVGVAFSTTNPSLVPFEMMACGCPVVDLDYNKNHINYGSRENVRLVGISPEEVALGIEEIITNDDLRQKIAMNGYRFVSNFPDDRQAFAVMEEVFLRSCGLKKMSVQQQGQALQPWG